jgi:hypothetical protein
MMTPSDKDHQVQRFDREVWRRGSLHILYGLPILVLVLLLGFRLAAPTWAGTLQRLVTSPYSLLSVLLFVAFVRSHPVKVLDGNRLAQIRAMLYWLFTGSLMTTAALGAEVFPFPWLEAFNDVVMVAFGAFGLGDAWQRMIGIMRQVRMPRP